MRLLTYWKNWKLRREERKLKKESERVWAEGKEKKDDEIYEEWRSINGWQFDSIDAQKKENISKDLIWQAEQLLLPTPNLSDEEKWISHEDLPPAYGYRWTVLTPKAMAELNAAVREEKKARLEIWESRAKIVGAIVTGLTGIIGTIIGLVAILKK